MLPNESLQLMTVMTEVECYELAEREGRIEGLFQQRNAVDTLIGVELRAIRDAKIYRAIAPTFEAYVAQRWDKQRVWAYRLIDAATIVDAIAGPGDVSNWIQIPESHLRPMASLRDDPPALRETWERGNEIADAHGETRTARHVQAAVAERQQHEVDALPAELPRVAPRMAAHYTSETPEWYTPAHVITCVETLFGHIDLDPCSNAKGEDANVPARVHFTREDDGLSQSWRLAPYTDEDGDTSHAVRAYVNPPYGDEIDAWVERTVSAYTSGEITEAVLLVPGRPGSGWWRRLRAYAVCLVDGRLRFVGADAGAPFPSALFYLGSDLEGFVDSFGGIGEVRPAAL